MHVLNPGSLVVVAGACLLRLHGKAVIAPPACLPPTLQQVQHGLRRLLLAPSLCRLPPKGLHVGKRWPDPGREQASGHCLQLKRALLP